MAILWHAGRDVWCSRPFLIYRDLCQFLSLQRGPRPFQPYKYAQAIIGSALLGQLCVICFHYKVFKDTVIPLLRAVCACVEKRGFSAPRIMSKPRRTRVSQTRHHVAFRLDVTTRGPAWAGISSHWTTQNWRGGPLWNEAVGSL